MRLTTKDTQAIKDIVFEFDDNAKTYLFGSRTDEGKRGGDIDLLIMSNILTCEDKRKIKLRLYDKLGEQKIDIIIAKDLEKPFVRIAYNEGVLL